MAGARLFFTLLVVGESIKNGEKSGPMAGQVTVGDQTSSSVPLAGEKGQREHGLGGPEEGAFFVAAIETVGTPKSLGRIFR